jgi:DNA-binding NtrC family response regulator
MLLETHGYTVTSAEGFVQALRFCSAGKYDLLIIGHSIPHEDKEALLAETRKNCASPVLVLLRVGEPPLVGASDSVDAMRPDLLLAAIERLLPLINAN